MCQARLIAGLPETLHDLMDTLCGYGYSLSRDSGGAWSLQFPPNHPARLTVVGFLDSDLATGLLRVLREEETRRGVLHRYEQFDRRWGRTVYGNRPDDTTIAQAGCGPTSLAIVLQYLMNHDSHRSNASYAVSPTETARYASTHGRVSGHGTAGDPMIRGIRERWPDFDGSRVSLNEAVSLLGEGKLIIFLCQRCRGWNRAPSRGADGRWGPDPPVTYGGHYMVLVGVEGRPGDELFYVFDPGRNANNMMRFISRAELRRHTGGFWWVYRSGEPESRISRAE